MENSFRRDGETWSYYLLLAYYAYMLNILGPLTPYLRGELQVSYTVASFHFSAFAVGILLAGVLGESVQRRLGSHRTLWFSALGMAAGTLLLIIGRSAWLTILAAFLMGSLGSFILALIPSLLSAKYRQQSAAALAEINFVSSIASTCAPLMVGLLANFWLGWRAALLVSLAGLGLVAIYYFRNSHLRSLFKSPGAVSANAAAPSRRQSLPLYFWVRWLVIFLVVALEFCMVFWGSDFLIQRAGLARENAVLSLTLFLGAMLIGRWAGSRLLLRLAPLPVFRAAALLTLAGFVLFWTTFSTIAAVAGLFLTGLGVANLYPVALSLTIRSLPEDQSAQASARAALASGSAILTLPLLLGWLADWVGLYEGFLFVPLLALAALLLNGLAPAIQRKWELAQQHTSGL